MKSKLAQIESVLADYHADTANIEAFIALSHQYRDVDELTATVINSFIDKVLVHAPTKVNGQRCVHLEIQYRFIGNFAVPVAPLTFEELQEEARRARERERNHLKYLRRKERQQKQPSHDRAA